MHTAPTSRSRSLTVLVAALSMLLTFAVPAHASDVDFGGVSAICADGQPVGLEYTARLIDRTDETTTATALIEWKPGSLDKDAYSAIDSLELTTANGFTASGSATGLDFLGEDTADVRVTITASDNQASDRNGKDKVTGDTRVVTVDLTTCQPTPEPPTATITGECTSTGGSVAVGVDNPTESAVTYVVSIDGDVVDSFDVTDGSETRDYAVADGTYDVVVTADGEAVASESVDIDCERGEASATALGACFETGVIEVELTNTDTAAATFVVTIDGEVVDTIDVTDGTDTIVYAASEGSHDVVITADGEVVLDTVVDVLCDSSALQVTFEVGCDETTGLGIFQAQLTNDGPATSAQVLVDGELVADIDVAADSITDFAIDLPTGLPQVVVISDGVTVFDNPIEVECVKPATEQPDPIVTNECQTPKDGIYTVTVDNPGTEAVEATVTIGDVVDETFTLEAGASSSVNAPLDNGTYVLGVTVDGNEIINESVTVDCTEVQGITDSPDTLPAAGAATVAWILLAMLLMFFGADVLLSGELRRRLEMMRG